MSAARSVTLAVCLAFARVATAAAQTEISCVGPRYACEPLMSAVSPTVGAGDSVSRSEDGAPADVEAPRRGRIVIDVSAKGTVQIFVVDREQRTLVRVIDGDGSSSVTAEIVAQIVSETMNALRAQEPAVEVVPPTSPPRMAPALPTVVVEPEREPEPSDGEPEPARPRLKLSLDYARRATMPWGVLYRDAPLEQGMIGTVAFEIPRPLHPFLAVAAGWTGVSLAPMGGNLGTPGLSIDRISARTLLGLRLPLGSAEIRAAGGFGADVLRGRAGDTAQGTILLPTLEAMVQAQVALPVAGLVVQGTLTVDVQPKTKFVEEFDGPTPPYDFAWTARLQPGFMVGIGWQR